jgi:hypothetical protein
MKIIAALLLLLGSHSVTAQVGIGTAAPDSSSALDITSTSKGLLLPRLSHSQVLAIASPKAGLVVYNTFFDKPVYYNGTNWRFFNDSAMTIGIGSKAGGGIVFYIDNTGQHGLIAAPTDYHPVAGGYGCYLTNIPGADGTAIGTGKTNTQDIVNLSCGRSQGTAASICDSLVLNGYSDWFLPSKDELYQLYLQKNRIGGFTGNTYWSSSEYSSDAAWYIFMGSGQQHYANKLVNDMRVRPIRTF